MKNKFLKQINTLTVVLAILLFSCSSLDTISKNENLDDNEGICILSFEFLNTTTVKSISFNILGNNKTEEVDISKREDNNYFFKLKKGYYQIESIKGSAFNETGSARTSTHFITNKRLYFEVKPGIINFLGHIVIKEAFSRTNSNLRMRGKSNSAYLNIDINFNERIWQIFKLKYPNIAKKYKMERNFISFSKPKIVEETVFVRKAGVYRGKSGVEYRMTVSRTKKVLKKEKKDFDTITATQIIERSKENSLIKYIFSDNKDNYKWRGRLYKIVEITPESESKVRKKVNEKYRKTGKNKWENNFENVTLKKVKDKIHLIFISKKYKKR